MHDGRNTFPVWTFWVLCIIAAINAKIALPRPWAKANWQVHFTRWSMTESQSFQDLSLELTVWWLALSFNWFDSYNEDRENVGSYSSPWLLQSSNEKILTLTVKPWKVVALTALDSHSQAVEKFGSYSPWLWQSSIGKIWLFQPLTLTVKDWKHLALTALHSYSQALEKFGSYSPRLAVIPPWNLQLSWWVCAIHHATPHPEIKTLLKHLSRRFLGLYLFHRPAPSQTKRKLYLVKCWWTRRSLKDR